MRNWRRILFGALILFLGLLVTSRDAARASDQNYSEIHAKYFVANVPGRYDIGLTYSMETDSFKAESMLESIEVLEDLSLRFDFIISVKERNPYMVPLKWTDEGNKNMFLKDDADECYYHFRGEGAAYQLAELTKEGTRAAYVFPAPSATAKWVMFCDLDQHGEIGPIEIRRQ